MTAKKVLSLCKYKRVDGLPNRCGIEGLRYPFKSKVEKYFENNFSIDGDALALVD